MKQIPLTQGQIVLVDDDMFDYLNQWKWCALKITNTYYAVRNFNITSYKDRGMMYMHHCIVGFPVDNQEVDHIDGNGLNNQRDNLRITTHRQNQVNRENHRNGKLPGVTFRKGKDHAFKPWQTQIQVNGKHKHLGSFKTEQEAYEAYLKAVPK